MWVLAQLNLLLAYLRTLPILKKLNYALKVYDDENRMVSILNNQSSSILPIVAVCT
jgi:hypothetical protein